MPTYLLVGLVSLAIIFSIRIWSITSTNLDPGIYLSVGNLIDKGFVLYQQVPESKPPLFQFINAWTVLLVGYSYPITSGIMMLVSAFTAVLVYGVARELQATRLAALLGAGMFAVFSSAPLAEMRWVMTEPYMLLFEMAAVLLAMKALRKGGPALYLAMGVCMGAAVLVRQTAAIFFLLLLGLLVFFIIKEVARKSALLWTILGWVVISLPFLIYFLWQGALQSMLDMVLMRAASDTIGSAMVMPFETKVVYFVELVLGIAPLFVLGAYGSIKARPMQPDLVGSGVLVLFWVWVVLVMAVFLFTPLVQGFHHEYSEIIGPLSAMGGFALYSLLGEAVKWAKARPSRERKRAEPVSRKLVVLGVVSLLLLTSIVACAAENYSNKDQKPGDYETVTAVAGFIDANTGLEDRIYCIETAWPKVGPMIYYESDRIPALVNRSFLFPNQVSPADAKMVIDALYLPSTKYVVVIGNEPALNNQSLNMWLVYHFATSGGYVLAKDLGYYSPFPGVIDNLPVRIYEHVDSAPLLRSM